MDLKYREKDQTGWKVAIYFKSQQSTSFKDYFGIPGDIEALFDFGD